MEKSMLNQHSCKDGRPPPRILQTVRIFKTKIGNPVQTGTGLIITLHTDGIMSFVQAPDFPDGQDHVQLDSPEPPPLRWIMVGYFFWVGIFLGALIMHYATEL
jgi:hypothetical protein